MDLDDIAGYSLRRKLGSGSAGTVWQVRDLASGRNAVLKRVPITDIPDEEKLREDLNILQRIRHPHIARLLEFRETSTEWLLINQYVVAGSLTALLTRRGPLSPGELVTLLTPLAEALHYLHRSGLTHGRLTPINTLFDADGRPVLTDTTLHLPAPSDPYRPTDDLLALATLAQESGGDPALFSPDLFTTTPLHELPRRLLTLAAPAPIDLAFPDDTATTPTPKPSTTDPLERSRDPLTAPPPERPSPQTSQASKPTPPTLAKPLPKRRPRAALRRAKFLRRAPTPINPLTRLTPSTSTPAVAMPVPTRPDRPRTRRLRWRRSHTLWRRLPHPAYGVLAAAALGAVVVLIIGIATFRALGTPTTPTAATEPTDPPSTTPASPTTSTSPTQPSSSPPRASPSPPASPTPSALPSTSTTSPKEVAQWTLTLQALDAQRAQAFWTLDLNALDKIYVRDSPPWRADRALLTAYRNQNIRVQGLRIQIDSTTITQRTPTTITLKTTDHLSAGQAIDHTGTTTPLPPGTPTTRLITLTTMPTTRSTPSTPEAWRITTITQA